MISKIKSMIRKNYDFMYLILQTYRLKNKSYKGINVGLSYSLYGINNRIAKTINFSLPSQDIKHTFKVLDSILKIKSSFNYCIIGSSFYSLHFLDRKSVV